MQWIDLFRNGEGAITIWEYGKAALTIWEYGGSKEGALTPGTKVNKTIGKVQSHWGNWGRCRKIRMPATELMMMAI